MTHKYYSGLSFFLGFGVVITWNSSAHVVLVNTADPITPKMLNRPMSSLLFRPAELFGMILDGKMLGGGVGVI